MTSIEADRRPNWKQDRTGGDATTWRDHRDDTTPDDEQRRRGDDRRWGQITMRECGVGARSTTSRVAVAM
ncbi:hypothetical protein PM023_13940 [Halorubrum ezzemoulense]|uniref:hypothetical protein n=1 Tax=Halorubrum ezzemoulense TaxID=337243 RepID=UPI00232EF2DE|nr:hypothetical protein [Halorubrum ezzemoulense]MDB2225773.1 hypothetical protein [Halorubrum ezzemoulense]